MLLVRSVVYVKLQRPTSKVHWLIFVDCYTPRMQVAYLKMHGTGNKILVVDQRSDNQSPPGIEQLRRLGDEATGPGFDQLMWVTRATEPDNAAGYRVFNADGSEVEQCGNGVRCVARLLTGFSMKATSLMLESPAGLVEARVLDNGQVAVGMGRPEFEPSRIPFIAEARALHYELTVSGQRLDIQAVSMGNPHCVLEVADLASADIDRLGPLIERHERFPAGANVGFMKRLDRGNIELRVHERGVGETLACGTGACAAVVCGQQRDLLDDEVRVRLPGGQLVVSWRRNTVWLTGNAELISEGCMDL